MDCTAGLWGVTEHICGEKTVQSCQVLMIPTTTDIPAEKIRGVVGKHHYSFSCLCCNQPSLDGELGIAKRWTCPMDGVSGAPCSLSSAGQCVSGVSAAV